MRWVSRDRYYFVDIGTDLLGDKVLTKYWGGLRNRLGGYATVAVGMEAITSALKQIARERSAHGYRLVAGESSHFQQPISEVPVNTSCMNNRPPSFMSTANTIQQTLETRNNTQPHPEKRRLSARSKAPRTPRMLPDHSSKESIRVAPQLIFPFVA